MKMNAPASPPAHRLPVLTEVVQLGEHEPTAWPDLGVDLPVLRTQVPEHVGPAARVDDGDTAVQTAPAALMVQEPPPAVAAAPEARVVPAFASAPPRRVAVPVSVPVPEPQPVARAPAFASSWWTDDGEPDTAASPVPAAEAPALSEPQVVQRVLADLDRQLDAMFDHRVHDVLGPVLARAADTLVRELRQELTLSLRDMVARAVAVELARHPKNPGSS